MSELLENPSNPTPTDKPLMSKTAIASLVCGILSFLFLPAIAAIVLGIISLNKIGKAGGQLKGKALAITGIVLAGLYFILLPALLTPAINRALQQAELAMEVNQMRTLGLTATSKQLTLEKLEDAISDSYTESELQQLINCPAATTPNPWIFFPKLTPDAPGSHAVLISPVISGKRAVLRVDGSVETSYPPEIEAILSTQQGPRQEIPYTSE